MNNNSAQFFIAQYVPDPFRKEATNVGVIVEVEGHIASKFFAEKDEGGISRCKARRRLIHPAVYGQWIDFWRNSLKDGSSGLGAILDEKKINFQVIPGGSVSQINGDSAQTIAANLYAKIVSPEADKRPSAKKGIPAFERTVRKEFSKHGLLHETLNVKHPIKVHAPIMGALTDHTPSFTQENGRLYVIQTLFVGSSASSRVVSDRAGATAHMVADIKSNPAVKRRSPQFIALLNIASERYGEKDVERFQEIVSASCDEVVNWKDDAARNKFIEEREECAA